MNLLDQKLKEKLLLFNNIDRETLGDTHSTHATNPKPKQSKQTTKTNEDQFTSKPTNKQYDLIYSTFASNTSKQTPISSSALQNNPTMKDIPSQRRKPPSESYLNKSNHLSRSKSKERTLPNNAGERLYNYGFYIKNKLKEQRKLEDEQIHRQMTPKMLARSKKMIPESNTPFEERLYQLNKTTHSEQLSEDKDKVCHTPKLNKKSLLMAEKLEPSSVRLLKRRKKHNKMNSKNNMSNFNYYNNNHNINNYGRSHSNLNSQENKSNNSTSPSAKNINHFKELYTKGIETMHKKDQKCKEQKKKNEEEYKKFAYKPKITKTTSLIDNNVIRKEKITLSPIQGDEMYKKQCDWKRKLDKQNEKKKEIKEEEISKDCTFKPDLIQKNIQNDEKFILKNINQMNQYVTKRRECIQMKKEYEEYKSKKLGVISNNNNVLQPTIPKGFKFETENRSHSREKKTRRKDNSAMMLIKEQIENNSNMANIVPLFKNNNSNMIYQHQNQHLPQPNNIVQFDDDQNEEQREMFINAVNALHYQIDNLNI